MQNNKKNNSSSSIVHDDLVTTNIPEVMETEEPTVESEVKDETIIGTVCGCKELYIRPSASKSGTPVCVVKEGDLLIINTDESAGDWYRVYTETGANGYCMKKFVAIVK